MMNYDLSQGIKLRLDGGTLKLVNPQLLTIKRSRVWNSLVLGCFSPVFTILILIALISLFNTSRNTIDLDLVGALVFGVLLLGAMVFSVVRSMRLPNYVFDGSLRLLKISGRNARAITFDQIKGVKLESTWVQTGAVLMLDIMLSLNDGGEIKLGSISGNRNQVEKSSKGIEELLAAFLGVGKGQTS